MFDKKSRVKKYSIVVCILILSVCCPLLSIANDPYNPLVFDNEFAPPTKKGDSFSFNDFEALGFKSSIDYMETIKYNRDLKKIDDNLSILFKKALHPDGITEFYHKTIIKAINLNYDIDNTYNLRKVNKHFLPEQIHKELKTGIITNLVKNVDAFTIKGLKLRVPLEIHKKMQVEAFSALVCVNRDIKNVTKRYEQIDETLNLIERSLSSRSGEDVAKGMMKTDEIKRTYGKGTIDKQIIKKTMRRDLVFFKDLREALKEVQIDSNQSLKTFNKQYDKDVRTNNKEILHSLIERRKELSGNKPPELSKITVKQLSLFTDINVTRRSLSNKFLLHKSVDATFFKCYEHGKANILSMFGGHQ